MIKGTYKITMLNRDKKEVEGYSTKYGKYDLILFKEKNGTWNCTEKSTGAKIQTGKTRKEALQKSTDFIDSNTKSFEQLMIRTLDYVTFG